MNYELQDGLLFEVQIKSFLAHDILLYLDTHPNDRAALYAYQSALDERLMAVRTYERQVGALTPYGLRCQENFNWTNEPFPWQ